jgi:metallopeptidase MepB
LRDASNASEKLFSEYEAQVLMEDEFFQSVDKVFRKQENIDSESRLYLEFKRQDFIKNGLAIKTESKRNRFVEVKRDIQDKEIEYRKSLNTDSGIWLSREELDGLPRHVLDGLGADEHSGNLWFPFKKPHLSLGLKFATRESTRRRIYVGNDNRCLDNVVRLKEILLLRDEAARLLGYQNHAELKIEGKMVESTDFINDFIGDLREKLTPLAKLELEALLSLKRDYVQDNEPADQHKVELNNSITATGDTKFHVWDFGFYDNLAIIKNHSFDEKTFSEYFSLQTTLAVMLSTYARLFSVQFHKIEKSQYREFASDHVMTWHEDVLIYTVGNDDEGSDFLGYLYLDLFPRDKKYNHAGHIAFQSVRNIFKSRTK